MRRPGPFDYHVCVHRFDRLEEYVVYPIRLKNQLPIAAIPLLPGDGEVHVDLQAVFDRCYDAGPYRRRLDYSGQPDPPVGAAQRKWIQAVLTQA